MEKNKLQNECNLTIDGQQYYTSLGSDIGNAAYEFVQTIINVICFIVCSIISVIIFSTSTSGSTSVYIFGFITLCYLFCAIYHYVNFNTANTKLSNVKTQPNSRPCKDPKTGIIIN